MSGNLSIRRLFSLKKMCPNCPWRADNGAIDLHEGRLRSICDDLKGDDMTPFFCHKTVSGETVESEDGKARYQPGGSECYCIGAMAYLHREHRPNIEATVPLIKKDADIA